MGLISLPIMLRYGYSRTIATGTITASGTLAQAIPPSLVLIVLADQLGRSVGDMYSGALIPGLLLVGLYIAFIAAVAIFKPAMVPALPPEALLYKEDNGASGHKSLLALVLAIGLVVDDAIVMLENIYRHIEDGMEPFEVMTSEAVTLRAASLIGSSQMRIANLRSPLICTSRTTAMSSMRCSMVTGWL